MKGKKGIIIWLVILFIGQSAFSQKLKIFDSETLQPVENVAVYSSDRTKSSISNSRGIARLDRFENEDSVFFQHPTYKHIVRTKHQLKKMNYSIGLEKRVIMLEEFVISANRWEQNRREVPNKITTLSEKEIEFENPQTSADLLGNTNEVFIQKSQLGGGSPMIRGFATNSVLIVVDRVRMNNAIFRSGNLQNVISLDPHSIENSEIIFGPGSVTYGSDALGGVMDFHTKSVKLSTRPQSFTTGSALARYSSANNEQTLHADLSYGQENWGVLTSLSYSNYGDLWMGSHDHPDYRRLEFVEQFSQQDTIVANPNPEKQVPTGYNQFNLMQKLRFRPSPELDLKYAFHFSRTSDISRYDRLIQRKDGLLKNAEWYYGPQKWNMHSLNGKWVHPGLLFNSMQFVLAYQQYEESRHDRGFQEDLLRHRTEKLDIVNFYLDFDKELGDDLLYYGVEINHDNLSSVASEENIINGTVTPTQTRYPNGKNNYSTVAGYIGYKKHVSETITTITGARYSFVDICSTLDTTAGYYDFPFNKLTLNTGAFNGSVGLVYNPNDQWKVNLNASSGFHAPNIDDMAKVFDSEPQSVIVPNENLKPEYAYNLDFGVDATLGEMAEVQFTLFHTWLRDAMVRREATFGGQDSILYDGVMSQVHKIVNADKATIYGGSAQLKVSLPLHFQLVSTINHTKGEDAQGKPLRHVAPTFGETSLNYENEGFKASFFVSYNGKISNEELAPSEQSKTHMYALNEAGNPYSPAWWTMNFKVAYRINEFLRVNGSIENITDVRYRPYSSGIVSPGRNFMIAVRADF